MSTSLPDAEAKGRDGEDSAEVVCSFQKNASQIVVGSLCRFRDEYWLDIRIHVPAADDDGGLLRTRKGIFLRIKHLRDLKSLVDRLDDAISLNQVVGTVTKGSREEVRVGLQEYKGVPTAYVRTFARVGSTEWTPTQKGVSINVSKLPGLVKLINELEKAAVAKGWIQPQ